MNYLVIQDNTITQVCTSMESLLEHLNVEITLRGVIYVKGEKFPASYNMQEYTREEVINDIERYHLKKIECMLKIGIYKLNRI